MKPMEKENAWIQTYTGVAFRPFNFSVDEINILDIAHALSMLCRYNGHTTKFYSVAEHSVLASALVSEEAALHALLHDAAETYMSDVLGPLKKFFPDLKKLEYSLTEGICERFDLDKSQEAEVKHADLQMTAIEKVTAMGKPPIPWPHKLPDAPKNIELEFWSPEEAEKKFLDRYEEICAWSTKKN